MKNKQVSVPFANCLIVYLTCKSVSLLKCVFFLCYSTVSLSFSFYLYSVSLRSFLVILNNLIQMLLLLCFCAERRFMLSLARSRSFSSNRWNAKTGGIRKTRDFFRRDLRFFGNHVNWTIGFKVHNFWWQLQLKPVTRTIRTNIWAFQNRFQDV